MIGSHIYVEPIVFFTCACTYTYLTIESEFVYQFVSESFNFTSNEEVHYCSDIQNSSTSASEQAQTVADEVARWTKIASMLKAIGNTISVLVITSWSDAIGRRNALFFPVIGALVCSSVLLINIYFRVSLVLYVISAAIYGATGGWATLINVGSAHLCDNIEKEQRGNRYTILEICAQFGGGLTQIGTGYWLHQYGFVPPTVFIICCSLVAFMLTLTLKTNTSRKSTADAKAEVSKVLTDEEIKKDAVSQQETRFGTMLKQLREVYRIYTSNSIKCSSCNSKAGECVDCGSQFKNRVWRLWMYLITYAIYMAAVDGFDLFMTMFLVGFPLCFTPNLVGVQTGMESATLTFSPLVIWILRSKLRFSVQGILLCAILGRIATTIAMFLATFPVHIFIGTAIGIVGNLTTIFIRVQVSNLVSLSEQGPALALIPSVSKMVNVVSPLVILSIYAATLHIRYSFIWAVLALHFVVAFFLMSSVWIANKVLANKRRKKDKRYKISAKRSEELVL